MPTCIVVEISAAEQACLQRQLRRARGGGWLALHILLLLAHQHSPTDIARWLFCSRTTVYAAAALWQAGRRPWEATGGAAATAGLTPGRARSLRALLRQAPSALGWTRTRWSCATLAASLTARRNWAVSAETVRRWLHALGWAWKRAKPVARNNDPQRAAKLARILFVFRHLSAREALVFADELDVALLAKPGYQWMEKGTQVKVPTPGKNQKGYVAASWDARTGAVHHETGVRKDNALFRRLLDRLDTTYPARRYDRLYMVVDNYRVHKARAVQQWLAEHPRVELLFLPAYCPQANPIERVFGDAHDQVTRNHRRTRLRELLADVARHFARNGPWRYTLGSVYGTTDVQAEYRKLLRTASKVAA